MRPELGETNNTIFTTVLLGLHNTTSAGRRRASPWTTPAACHRRGPTRAVPSSVNTSDGGLTNVSLQYQTDYAQNLCANRNIQADSFQATMQPFAIEGWVKMPDRDYTGADVSIKAGDAPQVLVDIGAGQCRRH